ncbi:MAG TPA: hypothetical protein VHP14_27270 [Anaerolineales bacterium]|nr:hypothetical protein [Anaerolineales bacterium]
MNAFSSSTHAAEAGVLPAVGKLLRLRLQITYNSFRRAKLRRKISTLILWLVLLGLA